MGKRRYSAGRCVIVGGAEIRDYDTISRYLQRDDFIICCDCGLRHAERLGVTPNLIVGDFDSSQRPQTAVETVVLPREKDDTDTMFAIKEAVRRGFDDFLLIGAAGGRLDHTLANIYALLMLESLGKSAMLVDDYSEMEIVADQPKYVNAAFPYFSVLNISGIARGIEITGAKYPLKDAEITCGFQYGISNEVLLGRRARITVGEGNALLIRIRSLT